MIERLSRKLAVPRDSAVLQPVATMNQHPGHEADPRERSTPLAMLDLSTS